MAVSMTATRIGAAEASSSEGATFILTSAYCASERLASTDAVGCGVGAALGEASSAGVNR